MEYIWDIYGISPNLYRTRMHFSPKKGRILPETLSERSGTESGAHLPSSPTNPLLLPETAPSLTDLSIP
jgi:hypothetical protein